MTKVLLLALPLPLYIVLFAIWWQFRHVIKMKSNTKNILSNDDFFSDTTNTPMKRI